MKLISILLLFTASIQTAPIDFEEDPELTGGFFEGDMVLEVTRNGVTAEALRWPNNTVYYKIDEIFDEPHSNHIRRAMTKIEEVSCIRFYPATENITGYINFISEPVGCYSNLGYLGKRQILNLQIRELDTSCFKLGVLMHEILHSLGFVHQHSASDRDDFVRIVEENIIEGKEGALKKFDDKTVTSFGIPYDYGSILHYGPWAFSKNGQKTIIPLNDPNIEIGQRRGMSQSDIDKLNIMYKCPIKKV